MHDGEGSGADFDQLRKTLLVACTTSVRTSGGVWKLVSDKAKTYEGMQAALNFKDGDLLIRCSHDGSVVFLVLKAKDDQRRFGPMDDGEFWRVVLPNRSGRLET